MNRRIFRFLFGATIALMICLLFFFLPMPTSSAPAIGGLSIYVTTAADEFDTSGSGTGCALREAIKLANNYFPPTFINFGGCSVSGTSGRITIYVPSGTYTLTLTGANEDADVTGDLDITNTMTISATGAATVAGNTGWDDRIIDVLTGTVTLKGLNITGGSLAGDGGGIRNAGIATLTDVTLGGNSTPCAPSCSHGGGLFNLGTAMLTNVTFSGNSAWYKGGGIYSTGPLTLTNTTLSGNSAPVGGGIYNEGKLTLMNTTLNGNSALNAGGGIFSYAATTLANTIVANSTSGGNCTPPLGGNANFSSDNTCNFGIAHDNVNVMLAPLGNYGGATRTHIPLPGSPAIDNGDNLTCPSTDQRGLPRPVNGTCDVGAVERQAVDFSYWLNLPLIKK